MHKGNVVVTDDHVSQGRQPLLYSLQSHFSRQRISQVLEFLVGRCGGYEETVTVTSGETTDDSGSGNGGVDNGYHVLKLSLKDRVKVGGRCKGSKTVAKNMRTSYERVVYG